MRALLVLLQPLLSIQVVNVALVRIREHLVRACDLLELGLCRFVPGILVCGGSSVATWWKGARCWAGAHLDGT